jgi:hypothetical protein
MPRTLSKAEAQAFRDRWRLVNERETEELRLTSLEVKLQQFNTLLSWGRQLEWTESLAQGEAEVRLRWSRLRKMDQLARRPRRKRGK